MNLVLMLIISMQCLQDLKPKESIPLLNLNITLNGVSGRPNVMQMTAVVKGRTRNYFVYSDNSQVDTDALIVCVYLIVTDNV